METNFDGPEALSRFIHDYKVMEPFIRKYNYMDYVQFDYAVVNKLTLFTIEPDFDFAVLEEIIDRIIHTLPAIKKIFSKPVLHLKERNEILPVEAVRTINSDTIHHISSHSELWDDLENGQIKPLKLLTKTYEDNYGIYENLVFCKAIDDILSFTRSNIRFLKDLIYTNKTIKINLLERVNHLNHFLALGKLHTGYIRNFDRYYEDSNRCLKKLLFILNCITPRLKSPVYRNNRLRPKKLSLRKTNILSMHRDYHQIYALLKFFSGHHMNADTDIAEEDVCALEVNYFHYCQILSIFAIGHFNFVCDEKQKFSFKKMNAVFTFKKWELTITNTVADKVPVIIIQISKDSIYKIVLLPFIHKNGYKEITQRVMNRISANEYIICTPYEDTTEDVCWLSISNVESFRRIQQLVLRGMIYSDTRKKECPFCNHKLFLNVELSAQGRLAYECSSCKTQIFKEECPKFQKSFYWTHIAGLPKRSGSDDSYSKEDRWLYNRRLEGQMFYRNITRINEEGEILCPYCRKVH